MKNKNKIIVISLISIIVIGLTTALCVIFINRVKLNTGESENLAFTLLDDGTYEVSIGSAKDKNIGIPSQHDGKAVTQIKKQGFANSNIVSVVLPDSLNKIDDNAFKGCTKLKIVTNLTAAKAKKGAKAASASIFDEIDKKEGFFGSGSFYDCAEIEELIIPDGVITIGTDCMRNAVNLKKVIMPSTVKYVYGAAFWGCDKIEEFEFSGNIEFLGMGAFHNTQWLKNQEDGAVYIDKCLYAYKGEVPETITVKAGTVEISTEFCSNYYPELTTGLSNLTTLNCNAELQRISSKAFQGCVNLEFVNFNGSEPEIMFMVFFGTKYGSTIQ